MAEYFETDEVTKGYDPYIFRRLLAYLKPYKLLVAVALLALAIGTAAELFVPVLIRDTVDGHIVATWARAKAGGVAAMRLGVGTRVGDWVYYRSGGLSALSGEERKSLEASGDFEPGPFYVSDRPLSPGPIEGILSVEGFESGDGRVVMPSSSLSRLSEGEARWVRRGDLEAIAANALVFFLSLLVVLVANFAQVTLSSLVCQRIMKDLRMDLYRKTGSQSLAFLSRHPVGRIVTRLTGDIDTIDQFFTEVVASFLKDASLMVGVLATLLALDFDLALIALVTIPPVLVATMVSRRKARDAFRKQRQSVSRVNAYISEHVSGISVVQLFARERECEAEFGKRNREYMRASLGEMYVFATFRPVVDFLSWTTTAIVIWFGAGFFQANLLSLGTLIAFINLVRMFYSPVLDISEKYTMLQSAMAGGERVFKLLDADERIPDTGKVSMPAEKVRGGLSFDKARFAYKEDEWVIRELDLSVGAGERVAVVGSTGAGKTTLANLVTRMWDLQSGAIRLDGIDIRDIPLDDLRSAIQPVLQDVFLFSGTIRENITLGNEMSDEAVRAAARTVSADTFIEGLPDGYDTVLAENATNISSGQRQLVSFARVVAHDPRIVILDEATSAIDTETEVLVQRGLEAMLSGRTSIAIAHRLSTIKNADRIIVLAHGKVAEQGTHQELLDSRGMYYNLYKLQYGGVTPR